MEHARLNGGSVALAVALSAGCAANHGALAAPSRAEAPAAPAAFEQGGVGTFHSARFELSLSLPDGRAWRIDDHRSPWLVATHAATASTLRARVWNEQGLASGERCLATARAWDASIPDVAGLEPVDVRRVSIRGSDMSARVVAAVAPSASGALDGWVAVVGASNRRCLLVVYATEATGSGATRALGERLATMTEGFAGALAFDRPFEVPRERRGPPR